MICKGSMFQNLKNKWKNNCPLKSENSQYFHLRLMSGKNRFTFSAKLTPPECANGSGEMLRAGGLGDFDAL